MDCWLPRYIWFRVVVYTFVVDIWIVWELSSITVVFLHACISLVVLPSSKQVKSKNSMSKRMTALGGSTKMARDFNPT